MKNEKIKIFSINHYKLFFFSLSFFLFSFVLHFSFAESSHSLVLQTSTLPEAKLGYTFNFKTPFMQGSGLLTEGNNINTSLTAEISPVSLLGKAAVTWTPIAFLEFSLGSVFGTGWTISLFGGELYGLGITQSTAFFEREVVKDTGSLYGKLLIGGAFQFDLAALVPGDWNHVIFRTYSEINYAGNSKASGTESWVFENDGGENVNGFVYYDNVVLGYQMPIFLNMVALMSEMEWNLYKIENKKNWGGDLPQWTFSGILNFAVHKQVGIAVITQFRTRKNYLEPKADWDDFYYRRLTIDRTNRLRVEFYRVAAIVTFKIL